MPIIVKNGYCLLDGNNGKDESGIFDILIEMGKIKKIDRKIDKKDAEIIDANGCLVIPAFCNAHTHLAMSLFRGMADDLRLMEWLKDHIFPAEAKYVTKEMVYWCSKLSMLEMIRSGTACFMDMYFFEEEVAKAAIEIGMKGIIGEGIIDFPTPDCASAREAIEKTVHLKREFESDALRVSLAPHSTYTLSTETLRMVSDKAKDGIPVQIHINENRDEIDLVLKDKGKRPIQVLKDTDLLGNNVYLIHCVMSSEEDINTIKETRSNVVTVPQSNLKLASGIAPVYRMLNAGINIHIGTDGPASNNNLDILEELRTLSFVQKAASLDSTALDARSTFLIGTNSLFDNSGKLKEGCDADIAIVSLSSIEATPLYNPYSFLVYAANSRDFKTVIINGKVVLKNGEFTGIDEEEAKSKVKELARKLGAII